jgi:cysteinyl-tRNA synthetase
MKRLDCWCACPTVDSEKMSKSLGNFFTIRDVLQMYHPLALRWFLINTQYRQPVNYTDRSLQEVVQNSLQSCAFCPFDDVQQ